MVTKEKRKEYNERYISNNKDIINERSRIYWAKNRDKKNEYNKVNRLKMQEYNKAYYIKNKDKIKEAVKKYTEDNIEKKIIYRGEYRRIKMNTDLKWRLNSTISASISKLLKKNKRYSRSQWLKYVGYNMDDFIKNIESKFEPWMSWDNYGKWHIDHIKPKSLFNYTSFFDEDFKKCWALSNLQPLEAIANIKKKNKYHV